MPAPLRTLAVSAAITLAACTDGEPLPPDSPPPPPALATFEGEYVPVDDGTAVPGWEAFRDSLRATVARKDTAALLAVVAPDARLSFGDTPPGPDGFRAMWLSGDPPEGRDLWSTLRGVLDGGSLDEDGAVIAPFVSGLWPDDHDPFSSVAIVQDSVIARDSPSRAGTPVARISHLILPALAPPNAGWRMVRLPDETVAYVPAALALSPVGYRATFWAEPDGAWFLRSFLAGD